jgi:Integrase core domain/Chromo (CHRromatin Organisation MOdifier) domain
VINLVQNCNTCQLNKGENIATPGLLQPIPIPEGPWSVLSMNFICGLPRSSGKDVLLVIIDKFTKYCHLIPLSHPFKAIDVAQYFLDNIYKLHGLPSKIITDRDPLFTSNFWKELMKRLEVQLNFSTAYHPQTDGQTERLNQCIEAYLRCMVFQKPKDWIKWVPLAEWWYNINYHSALHTTPFEALYGYSPPQLSLGSVPKSPNQAVNDLLVERQSTIRVLREQLLRAQDRMKRFADKKRSERSFQVGDWVYLKLQPYRQVTLQGNSGAHKLKPKFYGPFEVLNRIDRVAYKLNLPPGSLIHPVSHVSQIKPCRKSGVTPNAHLPVYSPGGKLHIEPVAILDRRVLKKNNQVQMEVLVKWLNLNDEEATWENYDDLCKQFPTFKLEDKLGLMGGVMSQLELVQKGKRLEAVSAGIKFKGDGSVVKGGENGKTGGPIKERRVGPSRLELHAQLLP